MSYHSKSSYNSFNKIIETNDSSDNLRRTTYKYDISGNLTEKIEYQNEYITKKSFWIFKYDSLGNITEEKRRVFDKNNELQLDLRFVFKYNPLCQVMENKLFNPDSILCQVEYLNWNEKGDTIEYKKIDENGIIHIQENNEYDERGNKIEYKMINNNRNIIDEIIHYKYDGNNRLIETSREYKSKYFWRTEYKYDKYGNLTETISYDSDVFNYKYEYRYY